MKAQLLVANSSLETGALLREYLEERGVRIVGDAPTVISYGVPHRGALNGICGRGKIFNMRAMAAAGVRTVLFWTDPAHIPAHAYPLLARREHGYGGKDLVSVFQVEEVEWRRAAGWTWFSSFVPIAEEYRVWVWQGEVLDVYQKQMNRPEEFKHIGRNYRNGFDFVPCPPSTTRLDAGGMAVQAIAALGLDFAAVDCIRGKDGRVYILETNTAPGVLQSHAEGTLAKLADRMVGWVRRQQ